MKRSPVLFLLGLSACSSASTPAGPPPTLVTPLMLQPPPIYALIGYRDRLELNTDQIVGLDSIASNLKDRNGTLIDELEEKSTVTRNQTALAVGEEAKPVLESIRDNNREAAQAVGRMLTSTQQATTCDLFRLDPNERDRDRRSRASRTTVRGADGAAADSIWRALESRIWPWCGAVPADSAATPTAG